MNDDRMTKDEARRVLGLPLGDDIKGQIDAWGAVFDLVYPMTRHRTTRIGAGREIILDTIREMARKADLYDSIIHFEDDQ